MWHKSHIFLCALFCYFVSHSKSSIAAPLSTPVWGSYLAVWHQKQNNSQRTLKKSKRRETIIICGPHDWYKLKCSIAAKRSINSGAKMVLYVDCQVLEHFDGFASQRQIWPTLTCILHQLSLTRLAILVAQFVPSRSISHYLLCIMDAFQVFQAFFQQEGRVIHQHVDEFDEMRATLGFRMRCRCTLATK